MKQKKNMNIVLIDFYIYIYIFWAYIYFIDFSFLINPESNLFPLIPDYFKFNFNLLFFNLLHSQSTPYFLSLLIICHTFLQSIPYKN